MSSEVARGYVTILPETGKFTHQLKKDLGAADAQFQGVWSRAAAGASKTATGVSGVGAAFASLKGLGSAMGLAAVGASLTDIAGKVITLGNEYRNQLNVMQAVSGATASQMQAVSEAAKQLGNDASLPATSAADAAAAMTELAKGGFTVEQSMAAAKGTLQLAAAAQVDAATAATIQSQALQAFGKDASYASTAADVLAGAANASSAEMTDVAWGLQAAGTVAHQFGVSFEDTSTTLAMFANAGIKGSDAGTLLKSALLALTDQGKPAQAAIEELGLTVYDAQGQFVGMRSLMGQLQDASHRMSAEQYQAATATLFGSDAMRLAGIAAEQGATGFDRVRTAVTRQGQAAEVAAAKTQGLPGAISKVQNAMETIAISAYEKIEKPLQHALEGAADKLDTFGTVLTGPIMDGAGEAFKHLAAQVSVVGEALKPVASLLGDVAGAAVKAGKAFDSIGGTSYLFPVLSAAVAGLGAKYSGLTARVSESAGSVQRFGQRMAVQQALAAKSGQEIGKFGAAMAVMRAEHSKLNAVMEAGSRIVSASVSGYKQSSSGLAAAAQSHRSLAAAAKQSALESRDAFLSADRIIAQMGHSMAATGARAGSVISGAFGGGFRGAAAAANGAMGLIQSSASSLIGFLGGPWGAAITVAGGVLSILASKHQEAAQKAAAHKAEQDALKDSLDKTTGAITQQTREMQLQKLQEKGWLDKAGSLGIDKQTMLDAHLGDPQAIKRTTAAIEAAYAAHMEGAPVIKNNAEFLKQWGVDAKVAAQAANGNAEAMAKWNEAVAHASDTKGFNGAASQRDQMELAMSNWRRMKDTAEGDMKTYAEIMGSIGNAQDAYASKQKDINDMMVATEVSGKKLTTVMDALKNSTAKFDEGDSKKITITADTQEARENLAKTTAALDEVGIKYEKMSDAQGRPIGIKINLDGDVNVRQILDGLGAEVEKLSDGRIRINTEEAQEQLIALGLAVRDVDGTVILKTNFQQVMEQQDALRASMGVPYFANAYIMDNFDQVQGDLQTVVNQLQNSDMTGHVQVISNADQVRDRLSEVAAYTETLPNGDVIITDNSPEALSALQRIGAETRGLPGGFITVDDNSKHVIDSLEALNYHTQNLKNGKVYVDADTAGAKAKIDALTATKYVKVVANFIQGMGFSLGGGGGSAQANGGILTFANGTENHIAQIAKPGEWRLWAEPETGGEAYIPLAQSKRARSTTILKNVANRFGYNLNPMADGGVIAEAGTTNAGAISIAVAIPNLDEITSIKDLVSDLIDVNRLSDKEREKLDKKLSNLAEWRKKAEEYKAEGKEDTKAAKNLNERIEKAVKERDELLEKARKPVDMRAQLQEALQGELGGMTGIKRMFWEAVGNAAIDGVMWIGEQTHPHIEAARAWWDGVTAAAGHTVDLVGKAGEELAHAFNGGDFGAGALYELVGQPVGDALWDASRFMGDQVRGVGAAIAGAGSAVDSVARGVADQVNGTVRLMGVAGEELAHAFNGGDFGAGALYQLGGDFAAGPLWDASRFLGDQVRAAGKVLDDAGGVVDEAAHGLAIAVDSVALQVGQTTDVIGQQMSFAAQQAQAWVDQQVKGVVDAVEPVVSPIAREIDNTVNSVAQGVGQFVDGAARDAGNFLASVGLAPPPAPDLAPITVNVQTAGDPRMIAEEVERVLRRTARTAGRSR